MNEARLKGIVNAPEFPKGLQWLNTDIPLMLQDFRGKIVLLDFWSYCCINCHHVMDDIQRLKLEFPNELAVIGVHSAKFSNERELHQLRHAILRHGITHPVVNDSEMKVWKQYAIRGWPSFVLINPAGRLVGQRSGEGIYAHAAPVIRSLKEIFGEMDMLNNTASETQLEQKQEAIQWLRYPSAIVHDAQRKQFYILDSGYHRILIVSEEGRFIEQIGSAQADFQDGSFKSSAFRHPKGACLHQGNLYIADTENHAIRQVDIDQKRVRTLAGNGQQATRFNIPGKGSEISLNSPWDIAAEADQLFIAMAGAHQIWSLDLNSLYAQPLAGTAAENIVDGDFSSCLFAQPSALALNDNRLYAADAESSALRQLELQEKDCKTLIGQGLFVYGDEDGNIEQARLQHPQGICSHKKDVLLADTYNHKIKQFSTESGEVRSLIGTGNSAHEDGPFSAASFNEPSGLCMLGNRLYIADTNNHCIRIADLDTKEVSTFTLSGIQVPSGVELIEPKEITLEANLLKPIQVHIQWPEDMKSHQQAPSKAVLKAGSQPTAKEWALENDSFTLKPFEHGSKRLEGQLLLYYCDNTERNCYFTELKLRIEHQEGVEQTVQIKVAHPISLDSLF
jgi:thiol-disulfide isomerase/thioredoxin